MILAEDVETRFDTLNYELNRPWSKQKIKKVIKLIENKLSAKPMVKFVGLRANTYNYLIDDVSKYNKAKGIKTCVIKRKLKLENHENCLEAIPPNNKINYLEKNK